jgi:hypothetical protein
MSNKTSKRMENKNYILLPWDCFNNFVHLLGLFLDRCFPKQTLKLLRGVFPIKPCIFNDDFLTRKIEVFELIFIRRKSTKANKEKITFLEEIL